MGSPDGSAAALRSTSAHLLVTPDDLDADGAIPLDDATAHHLRRVLRVRTGERVSVTDGAGRWRLGTVVVDGSGLTVMAGSDVVSAAPREQLVTIATAMPKGDRLDWLVQKVTELGVDRLVLLHCDRSVVRWKDDRRDGQLARLQRIADEACRQSRRVWRLRLDGPVDAAAVLAAYVVAEPGGRPLTASDRAVAVGPEGGWSDRELLLARDRASLGDTILRTETAAISAATLCVAFHH
jgi:16S rRNA (uracil1498-N3)-methyltransferase